MFHELESMNQPPKPFSAYTAADLWTDDHISRRMLAFHLDGSVDISSRRLEFIERSVAWIVARFQVGPESDILDLGCGPGLYANRLAKSRARVSGVDFSPRSIQYARQTAARQGLGVSYQVRDYLTWDPDRLYDLILLIMCDYCALSSAQRQALLVKLAGSLKPGGSFLFDVYSLRAFDRRQETTAYAPNLLDGFWSPNHYHGFLNTFKYEAEKVILDQYTIIEADRRRVVYNWLQCFSPDTLGAELSRAGLVVEALLADVAGGAYAPEGEEFAVIVRNRSA